MVMAGMMCNAKSNSRDGTCAAGYQCCNARGMSERAMRRYHVIKRRTFKRRERAEWKREMLEEVH